MKNFILSFFLIALSTLGYPQWQMLDGPYETHGVKCLLNHPNGTLFAVGYDNLYDNYTIYRSTNFGESWSNRYRLGSANMFVLSGDNFNRVFAGSVGGIYSSSDNGENWIYKNIPQTSGGIGSIAINSFGHIFAGVEGIYLSTNGGNNWSHIFNIGTSDILILENDEIYTATTQGIYFSSDNGNTWIEKNNGLPSSPVCRNIVRSSVGELFTDLYYYGIYKSTDNGLNWSLPDSSNLTNLSDLFIAQNDFLYTCKWTTSGGSIPGVYRSTNDGYSWQYLGLGTQHKYHLHTVLVDNNNKLYAGNDRGLYYYSELDSTWYLGTLYRDLGYIQSFAFCDENTIYASENLRLWKSTNLGITWNYINDRNTPVVTKGLDDRIFISDGQSFTPPPLIFSDNCGADWDSSNINAIDKIYNHNNIELYGGDYQMIYKSIDNGNNWELVWFYNVPGWQRVNDLALNSSEDIFVSLYGFIQGPPVSGSIWETIRLTNNATTFQRVYNTKQVFAIEIDGNDNIFLGTNGVGVVKSTDNGDSWISINSGLTSLSINDLTYSPEGILLAATTDGVFRYSEQYNYWTHLDNSGLVSINIHDLNYHNNILYAGTDFGIAYYTGEIPVELIAFTGIVSDRKVNLSWSTATELNNYGFEIQRKISDYNWITSGFVEGNGTTTTQSKYSFSENLADIGYVGKISYRLKQVDFDGSLSYSEIVEIDLPAMQFVLHQNYPNPFNPTTKINYSLPTKTSVSLVITDLLGREILKLVNNANQEAGNYEVEFDGKEFSSGVYFYTLITETFYRSNKMILIK